MSQLRLMVLAGLMLSGVLVLAACGDDDKKGDVADGTTPAATASGGGEAGELQKVADKFMDATFHVIYTPTGNATDSPFGVGGIPSLVSIVEVALFKDGQDKLRFDMRGEQSGAPFQRSFIKNGADAYSCFSGEGAAALGGAPEGACVKSSADDPTNPVSSISKAFGEVGNVEIQDTSKRKIAGEDATCFTVLDKDTSEVNTTCFSDDGVLLANASFEATSVERKVSDDDFKPPYEIADVPGLGQ